VYSTLLGILLAIGSTAGVNANLTTINAVIDQLLIGPIFTFETLQNVLQVFNHPPDEVAKPRQMTPRKNLLRIDDLSDPKAIRLTRFGHAQLSELYTHFAIARLLDPGEDKQILVREILLRKEVSNKHVLI
jgi:UDP-N-acetylmuramyl pentapeptide phosphotransferase/UDP-N-acetylglucosamine-1-phosphate transferase